MRKRHKPKNPKGIGQPVPIAGSFHIHIRSLLDQCSEHAVGVLVELLDSYNEKVRLSAASEILSKTVPTKNENIFNPLEEMSDEQLVAIVAGSGESKPIDPESK